MATKKREMLNDFESDNLRDLQKSFVDQNPKLFEDFVIEAYNYGKDDEDQISIIDLVEVLD